MKKLYAPFVTNFRKMAIVMAIVTGLFACQDSKEADPSGDCVKVSLVSVLCGQAVMHIEDPAKYKLGETWNSHSNVFFAILDCSANEQAIKDAPFFYVELSTKPFPDDTCPRCTAAAPYTGEKKYFARVVTSCVGNSGE